MRASWEEGGKSLSQYSQFGRSCNAMIEYLSQGERSWQKVQKSRRTNFPRFQTSIAWTLPLRTDFLPPLLDKVFKFGLYRFADDGGRAREAWRGCGLGGAVAVDEGLSRRHVGMSRGFREGEYRREADIAAFHDAAPFLAGLGLEYVRQFLPQRRPSGALHLGVERLIRQAGELPKQRVELRFDRSDGNEMATGASIDAVKMRPPIEEIAFTVLGPAAGRGKIEKHRHQRGRAVAHRRIHHLTLAGFARLQQSGEDTNHEIKRAAAEIADQIQRRHRPFRRADRGECAGEGDVVDVVTGGLRKRAVLSPSGHAAINQPRISRLHRIGTEP